MTQCTSKAKAKITVKFSLLDWLHSGSTPPS